jgi:hypothetical protein
MADADSGAVVVAKLLSGQIIAAACPVDDGVYADGLDL